MRGHWRTEGIENKDFVRRNVAGFRRKHPLFQALVLGPLLLGLATQPILPPGLLVGTLCTLVLYIGLRFLDIPDRTLDLSSLRHDPTPIPEYEVEISICRDGVELGRDQGVIRFVGPWLVYSGLATEFSVARQQVAHGYQRPIHGPQGTTWDHLWLKTADGPILLFVRDLSRPHRTKSLIASWVKRSEVVEGEGVDPPTYPHPAVLAAAKRAILPAYLGAFVFTLVFTLVSLYYLSETLQQPLNRFKSFPSAITSLFSIYWAISLPASVKSRLRRLSKMNTHEEPPLHNVERGLGERFADSRGTVIPAETEDQAKNEAQS